MSAFDAIVTAFVVSLEALPAVADDIQRSGTRPVSAETETAVNVFLDGAMPNRGAINGAPVDWSSRIVVELYARSSTTTGDLAVSALLEVVYARLAADTTLGGAVDDIGEPTIEAVYDANGQKTGVYRLTYTVLHRTANKTIV